MGLYRCPDCSSQYGKPHYPDCQKRTSQGVENRLAHLEQDSHPPVDIDAVVEAALKRHNLISD